MRGSIGGFLLHLLWWTALVPTAFSLFRNHNVGRDRWGTMPRGGARRNNNDDYDQEATDSSSIFTSLVRHSSRALAATARGSTQVAADLIRPKDVSWDELVGFWRLDLSLDDRAGVPPLTIHLTRDGHAQWTVDDSSGGTAADYKVEFRPAAWPRSARLKFGSPKFYYQCTVQRKLANLDIVKLRGKVYAVTRFQGKRQIGTFVGRRVVVVEEDPEDYDSDDDEEVEAENDMESESGTSSVASEDDLSEVYDVGEHEDYSDWEED